MKVAIVLMAVLGVALCAPQNDRYSSSEEIVYEPYAFDFNVNDDDNTLYSNRQEVQDEDGFVQGEYSWIGANGIRYITTYTADRENGFNAVTREEQTDVKVVLPERYIDSDEFDD